jgi:hypothetical protein
VDSRLRGNDDALDSRLRGNDEVWELLYVSPVSVPYSVVAVSVSAPNLLSS